MQMGEKMLTPFFGFRGILTFPKNIFPKIGSHFWKFRLHFSIFLKNFKNMRQKNCLKNLYGSEIFNFDPKYFLGSEISNHAAVLIFRYPKNIGSRWSGWCSRWSGSGPQAFSQRILANKSTKKFDVGLYMTDSHFRFFLLLGTLVGPEVNWKLKKMES